MEEKLPTYVVNCLKAAGYDVPEVILDMDVSQGPGNTISQIEKFIEKRHPGNPEYFGGQSMLPFEFPPGHRARICKFVEEARSRFSRKRPLPIASLLSKRQKLTKQPNVIDVESSDNECDKVSVLIKFVLA